jgi:hypothetical protein
MSFIGEKTNNKIYHPGYFLAHEECTRVTKQIEQANAVAAENGGLYVPMGTAYPADDGTAIGIVYEDVDVSSGDMPGSVVTAGTVWEDRLSISAAAKTALEGLGFKFVAEPAVTRP